MPRLAGGSPRLVHFNPQAKISSYRVDQMVESVRAFSRYFKIGSPALGQAQPEYCFESIIKHV